eukprot:3220283-Lingulodinium_polyedra.AAC.1
MAVRDCGSAHHGELERRPAAHEHRACRRTLRSPHPLRLLLHRPRAPGVSRLLVAQARRGRGATDTHRAVLCEYVFEWRYAVPCKAREHTAA